VSLTYRSAGVDITRAEDALARVRERIRKTRRPEVIGEVGQFGGLFASPGADRVLVATTDGVGTKLEIARTLDRHELVGADLVNHCVNDALAMGAEPLFFLDYFATSELDPALFARVVGGMADACARNGAALLGGETAEMPGMYASGVYDLAGFLVGAARRDELLGPDRVSEGDGLIGLPSTGLHTNGYSLARAILARAAGREGRSLSDILGELRRDLADQTIGDALLAPHRSYLAEFRLLRDAVRIHAIAHLTGGGWEGNVPRVLPDGLAAEIDRAAWSVPRLFTLLAELGRVSETESYDVWNMGVGIVFAVAREDLDAALGALPEGLEIGRVVRHTNGRRVRFV
jgi:phosphoribosylformylglycinamidine cyclo-ligase